MHPIEPHTKSEPSGEMIQRLEVTIIWMWSSEPQCGLAERTTLLDRLHAVSATVERLAFGNQFEPDGDIDTELLELSRNEVDALSEHWADLSVGLRTRADEAGTTSCT